MAIVVWRARRTRACVNGSFCGRKWKLLRTSLKDTRIVLDNPCKGIFGHTDRTRIFFINPAQGYARGKGWELHDSCRRAVRTNAHPAQKGQVCVRIDLLRWEGSDIPIRMSLAHSQRKSWKSSSTIILPPLQWSWISRVKRTSGECSGENAMNFCDILAYIKFDSTSKGASSYVVTYITVLQLP